jgi:hypothetical protein
METTEKGHIEPDLSDRPKRPASASSNDVDNDKTSPATTPNIKNTELQQTGHDDYITGIKLVVVLAAVTLIAFLMMLDMSIIVTARSLTVIKPE